MDELVREIFSQYDREGPFVLYCKLSRRNVRKPREVTLRIPIDRREVDLLERREFPNKEFHYLWRKLQGGKWKPSYRIG